MFKYLSILCLSSTLTFAGSGNLLQPTIAGGSASSTFTIVTNTAGASGFSDLAVVSSTNYLGSLKTGTRVFGPWLGTDYVQQAVNVIFSPTNNLLIAGGSIKIIGDNYMPNTLVLSNGIANGLKSFNLYAESYRAGALICATNPCIRVIGGNYLLNGNTRNNSMFEMHNLTVASIPNQTTNLFEMINGFDKFNITENHFGCWYNITNDGVGAGFSWPAGTGAGNLVVYIRGFFNGICEFCGNNMIQICAVDINVDHLYTAQNFFNTCGNNCNNAAFVNDWATGPYMIGGSFMLGQGTNNSNGDVVSVDDYFWDCGGSFCLLGQTALTTFGTQYEGMNGQPSILATNFVNFNTVFTAQINNARNYDGKVWTVNSDYSVGASYFNNGVLQASRTGTQGATPNANNWIVRSNITSISMSNSFLNVPSSLVSYYISGTNNNGLEVVVTNASPSAWSGFTAQADNGNNTGPTNYVGMYENNSRYVPSTTVVGSTNDGVIEMSGGNLFVDMIGPNKHFYINSRPTYLSTTVTNIDVSPTNANFYVPIMVLSNPAFQQTNVQLSAATTFTWQFGKAYADTNYTAICCTNFIPGAFTTTSATFNFPTFTGKLQLIAIHQ